MTENLIETVAEAAFTATRGAPWSDVDPLVRPLLLEEAKAAVLATLEAIREPSEAVYLARPVIIPDRKDWATFWAGAIDALRAEIESTE
jgi:hypothetical protein